MWKSFAETLYWDLRSRQETSWRDLVPLTETCRKDFDEGNLTGSLPQVLLQRCLENDLAQELYVDPVREILRRILYTGTCRIYPGISSSCSLQHCLGSLAGIWFLRVAPLSHVLSGSIASLTQRQVLSLWSLGAVSVVPWSLLGGVSVVSWWCPCGVLQATAGVLLFVSVFMRLSWIHMKRNVKPCYWGCMQG